MSLLWSMREISHDVTYALATRGPIAIALAFVGLLAVLAMDAATRGERRRAVGMTAAAAILAVGCAFVFAPLGRWGTAIGLEEWFTVGPVLLAAEAAAFLVACAGIRADVKPTDA